MSHTIVFPRLKLISRGIIESDNDAVEKKEKRIFFFRAVRVLIICGDFWSRLQLRFRLRTSIRRDVFVSACCWYGTIVHKKHTFYFCCSWRAFLCHARRDVSFNLLIYSSES
jgi:hypothetical protein